MATWIGHLRIAEIILARMPWLDETAFTFCTIAPDSGIPNADWTEFEPPKEVTHFLASGQSGEMDISFPYLSESCMTLFVEQAGSLTLKVL